MNETVFTYAAPLLKFGSGAACEIGHDVQRFEARRALLVTDAGVVAAGHAAAVAGYLEAAGVAVAVYDRTHVEPTDVSLREAAAFARAEGPFDVVVAVGGGSAIDTAKAANLLSTNDGDLVEYLNPPIGEGRAPTQPLLPLVAVPTTAGTGSESTSVCVMDVLSLKLKTGISHPAMRPVMAVVDPTLTASQPVGVTAAAGMDVLCHALESYTARRYDHFDAKRPEQRVPFCGANPIADLWAERALVLLRDAFRRAVADGSDAEAREQMTLAATFAGLGLGNAGVHVPHANAYPIAGRVRDFRPADYPQDEAMVPHGMAVALTAPEAFRFTFDATPDRHLHAARLLDPQAHQEPDGPDVLPRAVLRVMRDVGMPSGLAEVGYGEADVDDLVAGSQQQQRLLAIAPKEVTDDDLAAIYRGSMELS